MKENISEDFMKLTKKQQGDFLNQLVPKICSYCRRDYCDDCFVQELTDYMMADTAPKLSKYDIYREVEMEYRTQDIRRTAEEIEVIERLQDGDLKVIAENFLGNFDANISENTQMRTAILNYLE